MILSFINILKVPQEMLKISGFTGFQHLPRDLANVNEWKTIFDPYNRYSLPLDFFPNITSFSYFLECQNPDLFSIFQLPTHFCWTVPSNLYSSMSGLDNLAKTCYQPIFWHCLGAVLQYLMIFCENPRYITKTNSENSNKIGDLFDIPVR